MNRLLDRMAYDSLSFIKTGIAPLAPKQGKKSSGRIIETPKEEIDMCLSCQKAKCGGYCNKIRYMELRK